MNVLKIKIAFLFLLTIFAPLSLRADSMMVRYESPTGLYELLVPREFDVHDVPFRIGPHRVIYKTELTAIQDQRPYKNSIKKHTVRTEQTLGTPLSKKEKQKFIAQHLNSYIDFYAEQNARILDRKNIIPNISQTGGEIFISFEDPETGPQSIRARILFSDVTKMEQVLIGDIESMESYKTKDFFQSLVFNDGLTMHTADVRGGDWAKHRSPLNIFSTYLPKKTEPYAPKEPKFFNSKTSEVLTTDFFDPIWRHTVTYNLYGYKLSRALSTRDAKKLLNDRHIKNFDLMTEKVRIDEDSTKQSNKIDSLHTQFYTHTKLGTEYRNYVSLHAQIRGNYMIVHEVIGSKDMVTSNFIKNIREQAIFHPGVAESIANGH